jgi:hypothetical protein
MNLIKINDDTIYGTNNRYDYFTYDNFKNNIIIPNLVVHHFCISDRNWNKRINKDDFIIKNEI